jgi:hypothetical protein
VDYFKENASKRERNLNTHTPSVTITISKRNKIEVARVEKKVEISFHLFCYFSSSSVLCLEREQQIIEKRFLGQFS